MSWKDIPLRISAARSNRRSSLSTPLLEEDGDDERLIRAASQSQPQSQPYLVG